MAEFQDLVLKRSFIILILIMAFTVTAAQGATAPLVNVIGTIDTGVSTPIRITIDLAGNYYLTDPRGGGILKFNRSGTLLGTIPVTSPQGIAVTPSGDLIVGQGNYVSILDSSGREKSRLGTGTGQFRMANGIALDAAGYIYVADSLDNCIQVFTAAGAPVNLGIAAPGKPANSFGTSGSLPGQLFMPTGIAYEKSSGQLAIVDTLNNRVQFFTTSGSFRKAIGNPGFGALNFTSPQGVAFEYSKGTTSRLLRMYVVDAYQSNVQVIDPEGSGTWLGFIGSYGFAEGWLTVPTDTVFDPGANRLVVVNGSGNLTLYGIDIGSIPIEDTTPPDLTIAPPPLVTGSSTVIVNGTVEAGATVSATSGTATVGAISFTTAATWSTIISNLAIGENIITFIASDAAGNQTRRMVIINYKQLATGLAINPVTTPTASFSQEITGTMETGATISLMTNTSAVAGTVTYPSPTSWSSTVSELVPGDNTITITASKPGNDNAVASVIISLDVTPPSLTTSLVSTNRTVSSRLLTVTGLTDPDIDSVTVNETVVPAISGFFSTVLLLEPGVNTIDISVSDRLGNYSLESRSITYDPSAPAIAILSPGDGTVTTNPTITLSGTASASGSVTVNGSTVLQNGSNWSATVNLNQGIDLYTIEAVVTDSITGKSAATKCSIYLNDLTRPQLSVTSPARDLATNSRSLAVTGTSNAATITATINGIGIPVEYLPGSGTFTITPPLDAEGIYTLAVTASDALGNSSSTYRTLQYVITAPSLAITEQTPTTISGTGSSGTTVTVKDRNGSVVASTLIVNGSWSLVLTGTEPLPLNISATDAAGNNSRNGDLDLSGGRPDIVDAVQAMSFALEFAVPSANDLLRGDVAPLINGVPTPDGKVDTGDALIILRKAVGLIDF
jgi:sugar lactone lactonase YvrE